MKIEGDLKADELRVGRITIDYLRQPMEISALAALVANRDGQTVAWTKAQGSWSDETRTALNTLRECMEADIAKVLFGGASTESDGPTKGLKVGGGLGEYLEGEGDAPSI